MTLSPASIADRLHLGSERAPDGICLAWSGGLDSTVLLHLLVALRRHFELEIAAIHVDHGLRPDSDRDAAFCRRLAADWSVPLAVEHLEFDDGEGGQDAARRRRYAALARVAGQFGLETLATAHHADDALETALLQMVRGSGSAGLASLAPDPPRRARPIDAWGELELVRPLSSVARSTLEDYAEQHGLEWRRDPTNAETTYDRNRLRHDVLPVLTAEIGSRRAMRRTIDNLADESRALERRADRLESRAHLGRPSRTSIAWHTPPLADASPAETALLLRRAARRLPGACRWTRPRLDEALEAIARAHATDTSHRIGLTSGMLWADSVRTTLELERRRGAEAIDARRAHPVPFDDDASRGRVPWFEFDVRWRHLTPDDPLDFPRADCKTWFDRDELPDSLELRGPPPSGRLDALGFDGRKSILDILREAEISEAMRWYWPCLWAPSLEDGCLWVGGLRRSEHAPATASTQRVLEVDIVGNITPVRDLS